MFSYLAASAIQKTGRALVIVHRRELINQTLHKLRDSGIEAGVIMGADNRYDMSRAAQVANIQTLARRLDKLPPAQIIVIDEAHHAMANSYKRVLELYPDAVVIGATATPWRHDKLGLADYFDGFTVAATPGQLMESGDLVRYDGFAYDAPELHFVGTSMGDYNQKDLGLACNTGVLVGSVVREYQAHALGRKAIVFPVNIAHSRHLVDEFRSAGIAATHVDCNTAGAVRDNIMDDFRDGGLTVISSVGVLTEGFDAPSAEVCILARPTLSLALHIQMIGRVLRPFPGKAGALIHDHAGNLLRHGGIEDVRSYEPGPTPERIKVMHTCDECKFIFSSTGDNGRCSMCGNQVIPLCPYCKLLPCVCMKEEAPERDYGKEKVLGERIGMAEIRRLRARVNGAMVLAEDELARAAKATRTEKAAEYNRLMSVAQRKGYKEGWAAHQYRAIWGVWPRFTDEERDVPAAAMPFFGRF